jgi:signal transduction histidine kinase
MSSSTIRSSRPVQLTVVILLMTCFGQVAWWIVDQGLYSARHIEVVQSHHEDSVKIARVLVESGETVERVRDYFPELDVRIDESGALQVSVFESITEALKAERVARMNRYGWEGSFFLLVLLTSVSVIGVTLRQRTELLRRQQNFLAAVSHELKSPLASIQLSAETLLLRDPDKEGRTRIADRMVAATDRLATMVTNLLDAARLDEEQIELTSEVVNLRGLVERVLEPIICMGHIHGIEVKNEVSSTLEILADVTAVKSVVSNIVNNAFKSVQASGGGTVTLTAKRAEKKGKPMVALQVQDDGLGFDPKIGDRLFDKFFRPGSELTRKTKGAGLGLHIVRRFVELDGGRTLIHSEGENLGATFTVWWRAPEPVDSNLRGGSASALRDKTGGPEMMG